MWFEYNIYMDLNCHNVFFDIWCIHLPSFLSSLQPAIRTLVFSSLTADPADRGRGNTSQPVTITHSKKTLDIHLFLEYFLSLDCWRVRGSYWFILNYTCESPSSIHQGIVFTGGSSDSVLCVGPARIHLCSRHHHHNLCKVKSEWMFQCGIIWFSSDNSVIFCDIKTNWILCLPLKL